MTRRRLPKKDGLASALTPLLDTLFLLLFALLAMDSSSTAQVHEVSVQLPAVESGSESSEPTPDVIALEIDSDSSIRLAGSDIALATQAALDRALSEALSDTRPEEVVVEIRADQDARHGRAVQLLQHLRLAGFANVRLLATEAIEGSDWLEGQQ